MRLTPAIQTILLITVSLTPLFALREFLKFSGFGVPSYALYLNIGKDLLIAISAGICIWQLFQTKIYPKYVFPFFIGFVLTTLTVSILSATDILMVVGGLRWAMPFLLLFLLAGHIDKPFLQRLCYVVACVLIINTAVQLYQIITQQFRWGHSMYGGYMGRVSGFFELPSVSSLFGCLAFFIFRYYYKGKNLFRQFLLWLSIVNVFLLSLSTTGFILMLLLLIVPLVYRPSLHRMWFAVLAVIFSIFVYLRLDQLNGRYPGDSNVSWNIRVSLLKEEWHHAQVISTKFGRASNSATVVKGIFKDTNLANITGGGESLYPTILGNYGILLFIITVALIIYLLFRILLKGNEPLFVFYLLAVLGGLTVRITECFPVNFLIAIIGAYFLNCPLKLHATSEKNELKEV